MFKEIETVASECEYLFSKVRRLALGVGINPTPQWFKNEIGVTEVSVRREVRHGRRSASDTYQFLIAIRGRLIALELRLRGEGGEDLENDISERQLPPRRGGIRRGRDLFD